MSRQANEDEATDSQAEDLLPGNDDISKQVELQYEDGVFDPEDASEDDLGGEPRWQGEGDDDVYSEIGSEYEERSGEASQNVLPSDTDASDTRDTREGGNADDNTYGSASALGVCAGRDLGVGTTPSSRCSTGRGRYDTGRHRLGRVWRDTPPFLRPYYAGRVL